MTGLYEEHDSMYDEVHPHIAEMLQKWDNALDLDEGDNYEMDSFCDAEEDGDWPTLQ